MVWWIVGFLVFLLMLGFLLIEVRRAPIGYQDERGFHLGPEPPPADDYPPTERSA